MSNTLCPKCGGSGRRQRATFNGPNDDVGNCDVCFGTGQVPSPEKPNYKCPLCGSTEPVHTHAGTMPPKPIRRPDLDGGTWTQELPTDAQWGKHRDRGDGFTHHAGDDCDPSNRGLTATQYATADNRTPVSEPIITEPENKPTDTSTDTGRKDKNGRAIKLGDRVEVYNSLGRRVGTRTVHKAGDKIYAADMLLGDFQPDELLVVTPDQPQADELDDTKSFLNGLYDDFKKFEPAHTPEYWYTRLNKLLAQSKIEVVNEIRKHAEVINGREYIDTDHLSDAIAVTKEVK